MVIGSYIGWMISCVLSIGSGTFSCQCLLICFLGGLFCRLCRSICILCCGSYFLHSGSEGFVTLRISQHPCFFRFCMSSGSFGLFFCRRRLLFRGLLTFSLFSLSILLLCLSLRIKALPGFFLSLHSCFQLTNITDCLINVLSDLIHLPANFSCRIRCRFLK